MLGLIKKDLLMIKSNLKILVILTIIYVIMAFEGEIDFTFILPFMSVMLMISTFSYDSYNKWDVYACSLPNGRKNNVTSKYLATFILVIITTIIVTLISILITYATKKAVNLEDTFLSIFGVFFATILIQSFMYPAIYKFGVEKARIGLFVLVFGIAIIGSILTKFIDFSVLVNFLEKLNNNLLIILPIITITIILISYKISITISKKKEY